MRVGKGQASGILSFLALPLLMKVPGKRDRRAGREHNNMDHMDKSFCPAPSFNAVFTRLFAKNKRWSVCHESRQQAK